MYEYQNSMEFQTRFISREDRRIARQALSGKHGFKTHVLTASGNLEASLSDFSSLGFAISLDTRHRTAFAVGDAISISVSPMINHEYVVKGVIIDCQATRHSELKISAVIEHEQVCRHENFQPVHLTPEQSLKGQIVHPFIYKQNTYFELESLSRNGFYATNINSDFTLFDGMEVTYSLGSIEGLQSIKGKVSNIGLTSENKVSCFISTDYLPRKAEEQLAQHCFHFAQKTPRDIRMAGLNSENIQELVQYRFVETQAEYEAVLKLRRKSYASRGMCKKDEPIANFALKQDACGRILIVFHNARVIGTALLVFGERGERPFELDEHLSLQEFNTLPAYQELMEITAIFIEKFYQDTDVLHGVFESMYREGLSAGKDYVIVGSEPEWVGRYARMGFERTGLSFEHPRNCDIDMLVMVLNKDTGKTGKGMSPVLWWQVWGHVSVHLYQRRILDYSALQKMRVHFNRGLYTIADLFKRFQRFIS